MVGMARCAVTARKARGTIASRRPTTLLSARCTGGDGPAGRPCQGQFFENRPLTEGENLV
jgi:hypothetical protein